MNIVIIVCFLVSMGLFCPIESLKKFMLTGTLGKEEEIYLWRYVLGLLMLISSFILIKSM
ncbi:hypothetical protein FEW53_002379 [Enterococcus faecalis]|uniref:Uncharacterized protein n=1 Tax=Enterococcus faecalis RP2S-4 TaxID=1244145 RepID=A0ABC9TN41_ENTFL|nr:hypothetical protein [Enterococcus faecalis]EGO7986252.1 hypothetical protein [Enterococcus faecalis]EPI11930.1 hypothetical protein D358_00172 [Enterococcus faecalis RP2S-4]